MFVSFEGIDGCGKSTQVALLREALEKEGADPLVVREPGGSPLGKKIRSLLLSGEHDPSARAELMLFCASRAELVEKRVRPALKEGRPVIADRFYDSTTAYQGAGRQLGERSKGAPGSSEPGEFLGTLHRYVTGGLAPDRTYLLDVRPETAKRRQAGRDRGSDRMEKEALSFRERVARSYERIARRHSGRIARIDAEGSPEAVGKRVKEDVQQCFEYSFGSRAARTASDPRHEGVRTETEGPSI